jgi:type VI secretion system secreted protein VgrG
MSEILVQAERWLTLETPLGADVLVATEAKGVEGISTLFSYTVSALSSLSVIKPPDLLGKSVTLSMARPGGNRRIVNGIVVSFSGGPITRGNYRLFTLEVAPALWLLGRTSDYKVFQEKTAVEIAEDILGAAGISFEKKLQASYERRDYCVQFGETNLAFVERLFAEEGIFYYFTHASGSHKLIIADNPTGYADGAQGDVTFRQNAEETTDAVYRMEFGASLTDTKWTVGDYDFEAPDSPREGSKTTNLQPAATKSWEHYRFPAGSVTDSTLTRLAGASIDAQDARFEEVDGAGTCASFTPGHRFTLSDHVVNSLNKKFVLTEVRHEAVDRAHFTTRPAMEGKPYYRNSFTCIPAVRPARMPLPAPKPIVRGPQTARVVGPAGQEIHTDKYGRIRIQFPWDRVGTKDEKSSCFVHVAQGLAGQGWGMVFLPRIGMEVVVHFLDGDPDRPLVTGTVYNGTNAPPWGLPDNMTKSGFMSRSTLSGAVANANELSFEDKKGEEKVLFHAEKDFVREVENDDTLDVGHDQTRTVKNNRTTTITEGNEELTIKAGNRTETITKGNETLDIKEGNRVVTLGKGGDTLTLDAGDRTTKLTSGNDALTLSAGNHVTKADAGKITLEAMQGITLKCGQNTVEVTPQGVTVNGIQVSIKGTAKAEIKAPMVDLSADGIAKVAGGMVKIN